MSNTLTQNPLLIDTANTSTVLISDTFLLTRIRWIGAADGDTLILKDKNSNTIFESAISGTTFVGYPEDVAFDDLPVNGLIAHTIGSGSKVQIYYKGATPLKT